MAPERARTAAGALDPLQLLNALPQPLLAIDASGAIREVNTAAEHFFDSGRSALLRAKLVDVLPFGSPTKSNQINEKSTLFVDDRGVLRSGRLRRCT